MSRSLVVVGVVALGMPAARADSVNLLATVPATVAVSSTVANGAILPAHLVDGKLDTAWNSRTGELAGAWIGVRLPSEVTVESLRLTVGFTAVDKKWGDLFTMNPRIKRVRVTRDGKLVTEAALDPALRTLQAIAMPKGAAGGDYKVEVLEVVPGTRADWKEVNVSELEVWGQPGTAAAKGVQHPVVRVGGFDRPALTQAECVRAMFPDAADAGKITKFVSLDLPNDVAVCQVEHGDGTNSVGVPQTCSISVFKRGAKLALIGKLPDLATHSNDPAQNGGGTDDEKVDLSTQDLSRSEVVLRVEDAKAEAMFVHASSSTTVQLFRVTVAGAPKILEYGSMNDGSDRGGSHDDCALDAFDLAAGPPAKLTVSCTGGSSSTDDRGHETTKTSSHVDTYRWNGRAYVGRPTP